MPIKNYNTKYTSLLFPILVLGEVHSELLRRGINSSVFIDCLDSLRAQSKAHPASQIIRVKPLPLQIHLLDLVNALVRECNDAGLAVGGLAEEVALSLPHDEGGAAAGLGSGGDTADLEGGAGEGGGCGDDQGQEEGGDSGSHHVQLG
mmetsp:Transcript_10864/g.20195  ORF Transcript_10864/g.20195 Transcript_10864/m.20195 type:complete len:148 (-) Transcript_10864:123-566(-)